MLHVCNLKQMLYQNRSKIGLKVTNNNKRKNGEPAGQNILFTKVLRCCSICPTQDFSGSRSFTQNKCRKMFVSKPKVGK